MKTFFLKARHWQIFLPTFALPFVFQIIMVFVIMSAVAQGHEPEAETLEVYIRLFPVVLIIFLAFLFGWMWAIAVGLQDKVPVGVDMKKRKFKIFFFIPVIYFLLFFSLFWLFAGRITDPEFNPDPLSMGGFMAVFIPLHLFSVFCIFYVMYFAAKTFKTVELQREVSFGDFAAEFLMIWFYPVGIWLIQPKINRMMS